MSAPQDTVAHCRIPQYLPKEIKPKRKRKKKAAEGGAKPAPAVRRKEAPKEPEAELVRPEFLQVSGVSVAHTLPHAAVPPSPS